MRPRERAPKMMATSAKIVVRRRRIGEDCDKFKCKKKKGGNEKVWAIAPVLDRMQERTESIWSERRVKERELLTLLVVGTWWGFLGLLKFGDLPIKALNLLRLAVVYGGYLAAIANSITLPMIPVDGASIPARWWEKVSNPYFPWYESYPAMNEKIVDREQWSWK